MAAFQKILHYITYDGSVDTIDVAVAWKGFRCASALNTRLRAGPCNMARVTSCAF